MNTDALRYPIGRYTPPAVIPFSQIQSWIAEIEELPLKLREAASGLTGAQLDTPYRPEGWTLRQVIHHLPDSHMNAYIRFKLALTEENPTIRPYNEGEWAECQEAKQAPVEVSLNLLEAIHERWVLFLRTLTVEDFERTYVHPEHGKQFLLKNIVGMYAWHGAHHLEHVCMTRRTQGF